LNATATVSGAPIAGTFSYSSGLGTVFPAGTHTLTATFIPADTVNYATPGPATVSLTVTPAPLTVVANSTTMTYGGTYPALTGTLMGLVNGDTATGIGLVYATTPATTSTSAPGTYPITTTISSTNYALNVTPGSLTINPETPILTFAPIPAKTYGSASFMVSATSTSNGTITYTVVSGPATIIGDVVTITGVGIVTLQVSQAAEGGFSTTTVMTSFTVTPAPLTVKANSATRIYGTVNPVFTGAVAGAVNGNTFAESFSTAAIAASSAGTYAIVPAVTGTNLSNYMVQTTNGTLTIIQAASSLTLSANADSVRSGQSLTLMARVSDASSGSTGTPTGTVTFFDGTTPLGTAALTHGVANFSTSTLASGATHSLTASYSGDTNFTLSDSGAAMSVSVGASGFSFTLTGSGSQKVVPGSSVGYTFQVSPTSEAYPAAVSFAATGLPEGAAAVFSPSTVAADGGAQPVTMTVRTAATPKTSAPFKNTTVAMSLLLMPVLGLGRRRARLLRIALLLGSGIAATVLSGCGASNGFFDRAREQASQSYSITVTATSGSATQTSVVTLVVE
jgi:hypothetical protein